MVNGQDITKEELVKAAQAFKAKGLQGEQLKEALRLYALKKKDSPGAAKSSQSPSLDGGLSSPSTKSNQAYQPSAVSDQLVPQVDRPSPTFEGPWGRDQISKRPDFVINEREQPVQQTQPLSATEQAAGMETVPYESTSPFTKGLAGLGKMVLDSPEFMYDLYQKAYPAYSASAPNFDQLKDMGGMVGATASFLEQGREGLGSYIEEKEQALQSKYDGKDIQTLFSEGEISKGVGLLAERVTEGIPLVAGIMISGAAGAPTAATLGTVGVGAAASKLEDLEGEDQMSEDQKMTNAIATGAVEMITESVTEGLGRMLPRYIAQNGVRAGAELAEGTFKEIGSYITKKLPAFAPVGEGVSEIAATFGENVTDKYSGKDPDKDLSEGLLDSFLIGAATGGGISAVGYGGKQIANRLKRKDGSQAPVGPGGGSLPAGPGSATPGSSRENVRSSLYELRDRGALKSPDGKSSMSDEEIEAQMSILDGMADVWRRETGEDAFFDEYIKEVKLGDQQTVSDLESEGALFQKEGTDTEPPALGLKVMQDPKIEEFRGKSISKGFLLGYIKKRAKQIEIEVIEKVFEDNFPNQKKVPFEELEAAISASLMPLQQINSSTYASYGSSEVGKSHLDHNTVIFNSPLDHGKVGHFRGDFEPGIQNIEYEDLPYEFITSGDGKTYVVPRHDEGRSIWQNSSVFSDNVDLSNGPEGAVAVYETKGQAMDAALELYSNHLQSSPPNKGLFGHARMWRSHLEKTDYIAEVQSDYFQKHGEFLPNDLRQKTDELISAMKDTRYRLLSEFARDLGWRIGTKPSSDGGIVSVVYTSKDKDSASSGESFSGDGAKKDSVISAVNKAWVRAQEGATQEQKEIADRLAQKFEEQINEVKRKLEEKYKPNKAGDIAQFNASNKTHRFRMINEMIKKAAKEGMEKVRIPTWQTLAKIEMFDAAQEESLALPYRVEGDWTNREEGATITFDNGSQAVVVNDRQNDMDVVLSDDILDTEDAYRYIKDPLIDDIGIVAIYNEKGSVSAQNALEVIQKRIDELGEVTGGKRTQLHEFKERAYQRAYDAIKSEMSEIDPERDAMGLEPLGSESGLVYNDRNKYIQATISREIHNEIFDHQTELGDDWLVDILNESSAVDYTYVLSEYSGYPNIFRSDVNLETYEQPQAFQERLENSRQANNMDQYPDEQKSVLRNHKKTTDEYQKKYRKGEEVRDEDGNGWIEFDVTEEDAKAPVVAFQKEGGEAKGAVKFDKNGAATVFVFDGADISTLAHEMTGHVGRRLLERLAKKSPSFARDYESAKKWAGVKEDGVWTTEAEEKFARGFERYLRDRKAPTTQLLRVFNVMRDALTTVYKTIKGSSIDVELTPEIISVFDNLIGAKPGPGVTPTQTVVTPETSENYANLTEDEDGNFVFYHVSDEDVDQIEPSKYGTNKRQPTSKPEQAAMGKVGGMSMYYTKPGSGEGMVSGKNKYAVKVPKNKVYDFNADPLNLIDEARERHKQEHPGKAFDPNTQVAYVAKIAGEKGYDMVVAKWAGETRAQTTKPLKPSDVQKTDGQRVTKKFDQEYVSNDKKGWKPVSAVTKRGALNSVYDKIEKLVRDFNSPAYKVPQMAYYNMEDPRAPFKSQEEITEAIMSDPSIPQEIKDEYQAALNTEESTAKSINENETAKKPIAGNRLFNEPLKEVKGIADEYFKRIFGKERPKYTGTKKFDKEKAKRIAKAYDEMKHDPNNPEVRAAYDQLVKEIIDQYKAFIDAGYKVEVNNEEPYANSQEMIDDLRENKRIKIFSTESGFGDNPITDQQRKESPVLQKTEYTDVNGVPLLANDLFRAIHDFFGHAELGNSFGQKGEEIAWNVHARMFSPLARKAMTSDTRGQNSYVNSSGVNEEIDKLREKARKLRAEGKEKEAQEVVAEIYEKGSFADQKVGLLPDEFTSIDESDTGDAEGGESGIVPTQTGIAPVEPGPVAPIEDDGSGLPIEYQEEARKAGFKSEPFDGVVEEPKKKPKARLIEAAKRFYNNWLNYREGRPKAMQNILDQRDGAISVVASNIDSVARSLNRAFNTFKGEAYNDIVDRVDKALRGDQEAMDSLPTVKVGKQNIDLKVLVSEMRANIDHYSTLLMESGQISAELAEVISGNRGKYLTRVYEIHRDKKWEKRVKQEVKQAAENYLYEEYLEKSIEQVREETLAAQQEGDAVLEQEIIREGKVRAREKARLKVKEILETKEFGSLSSATSKLGAKDLGILKQKQDIPAPIRALMGEVTDPIKNYAQTLFKLGSLVETDRTLEKLRDLGLKEGWFYEANDPNRPSTHSEKVAADGSNTMSPLNGLYTTKEISKSVTEQIESFPWWMEQMWSLIGNVKWAKTIGSVVTHIKNVWGNVGFMMANGHLRDLGKNIPEAVQTIIENEYSSIPSNERRAFYNNLLRLGVINQSTGFNELNDLMRDGGAGRLEDILKSSTEKKTSAARRAAKNAGSVLLPGFISGKAKTQIDKLYQAEDDFFKILAFMAEKRRYEKALAEEAGFDLATINQVQSDGVVVLEEGERARYEEEVSSEAEKIASENVKNTYPTYSRVPPWIKSIRRFPFIGNFISFQAEAWRTAFNTIALAGKEMNSSNPAVQKIGQKRMLSAVSYASMRGAVTSSLGYAAGIGGSGAIGLLMGLGDDEAEETLAAKKKSAIKRYVAPWSKNSDLWVMQAGDGKIKYVDLSSSDPHGGISQVVNAFDALGKGEKDYLGEGFLSALNAAVSPFLGVDISTRMINNIANNLDEYGRQIYNPAAGEESKAEAILSYVGKTMEPGTASTLRRMYGTDKIGTELAATFLGMRVYQTDVADSFGIRLSAKYGYGKDYDNARGIYTKVYYDKDSSKEAKEAAYKEANEAALKYAKEARKDFEAAVRLGASEEKDLIPRMNGARMSRGMKEYIKTGNTDLPLVSRVGESKKKKSIVPGL